MYAVRVYKSYDTDKYLGVKIVNSKTLEIQEFDWSTIKIILKNTPNCIKNMEIDINGKVVMKNLNPDKRIKYYKQSYVDNFKVNHYCIITGQRNGLLDFLADSTNDNNTCNIMSGHNVSLGDIANMLNISDIQELRLYNAKIEKVNNNYNVYIFNGLNYNKVQDIKVTSINKQKFKDWDVDICSIDTIGIDVNYIEHKNGAGKATIPDGICHIDKFGGKVNSLILPMSVKTLGRGCFECAEDLHEITLSKGLKNIPEHCFEDSSLRKIKFTGNEETIGYSAFESCRSLKQRINTNAKVIEEKAFSNSGISGVTFYRAEFIGKLAFEYCDRLKDITFGDKLKIIGPGAFAHCSQLETIELPKTVKKIYSKAFYGCNKIKEVKLPHGVQVAPNAFPKRTKLVYYNKGE